MAPFKLATLLVMAIPLPSKAYQVSRQKMFRRVRTRDPLRAKALAKGLNQLSEEGAAQVFKLESRNELIVGAIGLLQYDVVQWRLQNEYNVECIFEPGAVPDRTLVRL